MSREDKSCKVSYAMGCLGFDPILTFFTTMGDWCQYEMMPPNINEHSMQLTKPK